MQICTASQKQMSKKFIKETAKLFRPDIDFEECEDDKGWLPFLLNQAAKNGIQLVIRYAMGWKHVPPRRPFQLEILTEDDDEFTSYIVAFFGTEQQARRWAKKKGLTVKKGLEKI